MWLIYLLSIIDGLINLSIIGSVIAEVFYLIFNILHVVSICDPKGYTDDEKIFFNKVRKTALSIFIPFLLFAIFTPNAKQIAIIFSVGTTIDYVRNNEKIKELPDKAVDCLNKYIDEYLSEDGINKSE